MNRHTEELVAELQHSKEMEKKGVLKINNLEKQLEKMMNLQQKNKKIGLAPVNTNYLNSSRRS